MPRPTPRRDTETRKRSSAAVDVVSPNEAAAASRAEEERQIRAALAEYFSILQEWSINNRRTSDAIEPNGDSMTP